MEAMEVADKLREMFENYDNVMARIDDVRREIERNGGFGLDEKNKLLDLKIECEDIAWELGKVLGGVA